MVNILNNCDVFRLKEDELFKKADELEAKNMKLEQELSDALAENKRLRSKLSKYETEDEFCQIDDDQNWYGMHTHILGKDIKESWFF